MTAETRLRFLADASALLAASLDINDTLRMLAHAIVPTFADWCTINVIDEAGVPHRVAGIHADPAKRELMDRYLHAYEPSAHRSDEMIRAVRDGNSYFYPTVDPAQLVESAQDADHLRIMVGLGCTSSIVVPLVARSVVIGAMSMQMSTTERAFVESDYQLARDVAGRAGLAIDNARRFAAERAARERAERAETEYRALYAERQQLLREAEAANRAKDAFLAMLGHELRNPLAPIVTAIELMDRAGGPFVWERQVIARQTRHLARLVDDLLDVSRITGGKVPLAMERVEIGDVVFASIEMAEQLFDRGGQRLFVEVGDRLVVVGDRTRLVQVVANLLMNAAKFTGAGAEIRLSAERDGEHVVVRVRDTGVGIAPEALPHVFDMFVQGPQSIDRSHGGLGLGLTIARSLVEAHDGTITAASDGLGRGAEMSIRLPLADDRSPVEVDAIPELAPSTAGMRVVVVDDNEDSALLVARSLERHGFAVRVAHDGAVAIDVCRDHRPAAAILDIGLPVIDGYELARRLRAVPELAEICLIAMTGYGQATDRERAMEAGFDHHLVKPVTIAALRAILDVL